MNDIKFSKYMRLVMAMLAILGAYVFLLPIRNAFAEARPVEVGSPRWWENISLAEDTRMRDIKKYPEGSPEYLSIKESLDHIQKEKCIVGRMYGLPKDSLERRELDEELDKLIVKHRKDAMISNMQKLPKNSKEYKELDRRIRLDDGEHRLRSVTRRMTDLSKDSAEYKVLENELHKIQDGLREIIKEEQETSKTSTIK